MVNSPIQLCADRLSGRKVGHPDPPAAQILSGTITGDSKMKYIKLSQNKRAMVDDADFGWLNQWKWHAIRQRHLWYAARPKSVKMHRLIMGLTKGDGKEVDHKNGNGVDNRRENLRICTRPENIQNQHIVRGSCKYQGVCRDRTNNKWMAYIMKNGKQTTIGLFKNKKDAARAYDKKALELYGPDAKVNFPLGE